MRRFIIGGNWKMQIHKVNEAVNIAEEIANSIKKITSVDIFIAPSVNALYSVAQVIFNTNLGLSGQNIYYREEGAFTGQTSILSLIDAGCKYCIIGHSEMRRLFGEKDEEINLKIIKCLEKGLIPVFCVGEDALERNKKLTKEILNKQLSKGLSNISKTQMQNLVIAYEPVWAINNKYLNPDIEIRPATPKEASKSHFIIRNWVKEHYGESIANELRIIYGGSMNKDNCDDLLSLKDIDGGLIGSASLSKKSFLPIIESAVKFSQKNLS